MRGTELAYGAVCHAMRVPSSRMVLSPHAECGTELAYGAGGRSGGARSARRSSRLLGSHRGSGTDIAYAAMICVLGSHR
eukprot:1497555-Rhodomonas_salina.1